MDEVIYVFVKWNEKDNRVEVDPSSIELTDAVEWVYWVANELPPQPKVTVRFSGSVRRGPFKKLVADRGKMRGSGNRGRGSRAKAPSYSYTVVLHSPDGPKSGSGRVTNRATKPKAVKRPKGPIVIPQQPTGPPD
ncbi:MAG TPA: hypothetical protein VNW71_07285 [Thermoanaerobaculia bacterium]|nr:hypothetical protein [Thermoanaerobaculia bacterium]